ARPLLARYARCAPTPARVRRAPQTPSASSSALALGLPLSGPARPGSAAIHLDRLPERAEDAAPWRRPLPSPRTRSCAAGSSWRAFFCSRSGSATSSPAAPRSCSTRRSCAAHRRPACRPIRPRSSRRRARATSDTSWRSPSSLSTSSCCGPGGSSARSGPSSSRSACCACGCARRAPREAEPARIDFPAPGAYNADKFAQRSGGRPDAGGVGGLVGRRRPGPGGDEPESSAAVESLVALLGRVLGLERAALLVEKLPRGALVPVVVHGEPPPAPLAPGEAPDAGRWGLALPVGAGDRVRGLLLLARAGGAPLTPAERALAAGVADALAQLVASERQAAELRQTREGTDLNELVAQLARRLEAEARRRDVAVSFHGEPDLPQVVVDEAQVKQVLMNLLLNALQACGAHGSVEITTRSEENRGERWC